MDNNATNALAGSNELPSNATRSGTGLIRALGPLMATAVVVGTVIGSGIFKKPQSIAQQLPYSGMAALVWIAGGLLVLLGALAYSEVTTLLPKAGGNYVFLREGYGRLAGFLWGWVEFWIIRAASLAALATIFSESLHDLVHALSPGSSFETDPNTLMGFWSRRAITVLVLLGLALVNVRGTRWGGGLQLFITLVKVGSLLGIFLLPFAVLALGRSSIPSWSNLHPIWPSSWSEVKLAGLSTAFLGVLWAYHGWMNISPVAEEIKNPQRNLPLALLSGVLLLIFLYLGVNLAYYLVIPSGEMAELKNTTVAAELGLRLLGPSGAALASAAVMCSVFGALNGNLLVGPRVLYAMGGDHLAPYSLYRVHPRYHTPARAIMVMAAWAAILVVGAAVLTKMGLLQEDKSHFDMLTDFAMFGAVIFETMAVVVIFVLRRKMPDAERPYRCLGYPVVPILYVILPAFVLVNMFQNQQVEAATGTCFILLGALVYYLLDLGRSR